ncbi:hypothetical protein GWK47_030010 [Chionoecetes opilio]|uniref:Ionotropic glutamate receptor C-terminal domain-containing protein n=1 Tax=Chionoecetes opilio TaxID=41210 RepID=A0A8J5D5D2_CHIOP|nr:hypothetical protein GWK47_030010 [Chionoecetes opilio]
MMSDCTSVSDSESVAVIDLEYDAQSETELNDAARVYEENEHQIVMGAQPYMFEPEYEVDEQVTSQVTSGRSMLVPIRYVFLQTRLQLYDFTYPFDYINMAFALATPLVSPSWLSLYLPLSGAVWLATLLLVCLLPVVLKAALRREGRAVDRTLRTLLAQDLPGPLPAAPPYRLLLGAWMLFALVFGAAYRGNLTAALTIPKYPKRIESLRELVAYVDRITMSPYGTDYRDSYMTSESPLLKAVGRLIQIVPNRTVGLTEALYKREGMWSVAIF